MRNLQGPRGLKGEIGERGLPGQDEMCGCNIPTVAKKSLSPSDGFDIDDADKIESKTVAIGTTDSTVDFNVNTEAGTPAAEYNGYKGSMVISK